MGGEPHARGGDQAKGFGGAVEVELEAEPTEQSYCWGIRWKGNRTDFAVHANELWRRGNAIRIDCFLEGKGCRFD
jgi:hypothetical protein